MTQPILRAQGPGGALRRLLVAPLAILLLLLAPRPATASLMSPETEDAVAGFLAVVILFVVPIVLIVLFWLVHILPEKIAHRKHHPQFEAIRTLCLLSLVFGGLLWPLAWIWAYTRPVMHKMAYGTDKVHHDAVDEEYPGEELPNAADLRDRLQRLEGRGVPATALLALRADVERLEAEYPEGEAK